MSVEKDIEQIKEDLQEHQASDAKYYEGFDQKLIDLQANEDKKHKEIMNILAPMAEAFKGVQFSSKWAKKALWLIGAVLGIVLVIQQIIHFNK